jgi:xylulokinase
VIDWMTRLFCGTNSPEAIQQLAEEATSAPPGAGGIWFQPYLDGSGPPERDAEAGGAWVGLKLAHGRAALVRAAMEGLCYGFRKLLENLETHANLDSTELRTVGGGTRNTVMQALKANILGLSIDIPAVTEVTAQGAALWAGIGAGVFADEADAAHRGYRSATRYEVDPQLSAWYDQKYKEVFPQLYSCLHQFQVSID